MCDHAAAQVIAGYSTSFSLASKFLAPRVRRDIANLYAMVRIADEIVDGTASAAGVNPADALGAYEAQVLAAPAQRFHTDPVLHAYAATARRCGFDQEHVRAFFTTMRRDLTHTDYAADELEAYVYGSAEVIGLLCLGIFLTGRDTSPADRAEMEAGARALGSAFQKINFLRDYGEDRDTLGRRYYDLDDATKDAVVAEIRAELAQADSAIPLLPRSARAGVAAAAALFAELTDTAERTPAAELATTRISVPAHRKLAVTARAVARKGTHV
ncbi:squalene/phytoene synthase family protein [Corynebacterium sp. TA-R-1]|uniref:Squalene/phytoene synthase family protein n=1 Tax=Corynebacterium stercoris TaxID=2943490 RepID=A0ABT1G134_9CORY|nr:squalene/phytoene synthase family protein [Corynebacterium stercoris]MCP1387736.1 squalene/phytoene synthase family protein [Corynebacterium stercoris]